MSWFADDRWAAITAVGVLVAACVQSARRPAHDPLRRWRERSEALDRARRHHPSS